MENNQKKEVNEALHAIEETLGHLSRAQDYLMKGQVHIPEISDTLAGH